MVAQLLMLFDVRSQGELAVPKADSSAFIERSRRLDRIYSIDADEAPFCANAPPLLRAAECKIPGATSSDQRRIRERRASADRSAGRDLQLIIHMCWEGRAEERGGERGAGIVVCG